MEKNEIEEKIRSEAKQAVEAAIVGKIEIERRERKKKRRKRFFKFLGWLIKVGSLIGIGFMIGVHRKAIKAYFTGGKMPKIPAKHYCPIMDKCDCISKHL